MGVAPAARPYTMETPLADLPPFLANLNPKQREAALQVDGPLIVLAGAGSGKTKMLTSRIAYLIGFCGVPSYQVLAVTFTNKAAGEMKERVEKALHESSQLGMTGGFFGSPEIGTFHAVCVRLLRREMDRTPFTKPFVIYDDSDQLALVKSVLNKLDIDPKSFNPKALQAGINRLKCDATEPEEFQPGQYNAFEKKLKEVYAQYQKDLFANNALDFGEIICMTYRLLRQNEDLRRKYQARFKYIHVDEYQDTNRAQYLLLSTLASPTQGGHANICVVGDEDQSIYKWRGADIKNILDFEKEYPQAYVVKLEQNYRSTQTIIEAASHLIGNNKERKNKRLWTENEKGSLIQLYYLADERAEAELVVGEVKRLMNLSALSLDDFAIFYRTHAQSRQFEDVLRREKLSYQVVGGTKFYERKEIKDILAYFRLILNAEDSVSLGRVINVPARGIGKTTLEKIDQMVFEQGQAQQGTLGLDQISTVWQMLIRIVRGDANIFAKKTLGALKGFVDMMEKLAKARTQMLLSELYHAILDETGYVRELRKEATVEAMARIENLEEFDTLIQEFEETALQSLEGDEYLEKKKTLLEQFIEQTSLASPEEVGEQDKNITTLRMMTLHGSKGLEYPVVFMVGMEEGLFPSIKAWEETEEEDIEEERRLCYVGMTRARQRLYMMTTQVRRIWGNIQYQDPARFISEIPDDYLDAKDLTGRASHGSSNSFAASTSTSWGSVVDRPRPASGFSFQPSGGASKPTKARKPEGVHVDTEEANDYVGRYLDHPEYGEGTIVAVEGAAPDHKVVVEFKGRVRRKFLLKYVSSYLD